ncbi:MAG: AtpZ/AtpI family protein [Planctomycetaceae bacterium]|jgi:F0F1-type ATP synthase assembly protein I|nr:AtpZ/AtpI family protein [Planctomycetaceae bacterium]
MNNNCNDKTKTKIEIESGIVSELPEASELENKNNIQENQENNDSVSTTYILAAQISNIGFETAIPLLLGIGLDYWLGTVAVFAIIGTIIGFVIAFLQLIKFAKKGKKQN